MQIKDYIQGNKHGKEANRLEREAMHDTFLQEALEGFDSVQGNHAEIIERLEKKIGSPAGVSKNNRRILYFCSIAATVLLLIGFGVYFIWEKNDQKSIIAMVQHGEYQEETERLVPESESPLSASPSSSATPPSESSPLSSALSSSDLLSPSSAQPSSEILPLSSAQPSSELPPLSSDQPSSELPPLSSAQSSSELLPPLSAMPSSKQPSPPLPASVYAEQMERAEADERADVQHIQETQKSMKETYSVARRTAQMAAGSKDAEANAKTTFGKKEFQAYCLKNAEKKLCNSKSVSVRVAFYIDSAGKPLNIKCDRYTCEDAKKEIERLLSESPAWTTLNRQISMTIKW